MSRSTYHRTSVCVAHRLVSRADDAHCPACGRPMVVLGTRWRVPKKSDDRGWVQLTRLLLRPSPIFAAHRLTGRVPVLPGQESEYRPSYRLRRIVRRPGA